MRPEPNPEVADITDIIGKFPYRLALAGGWIDQPFVSRHNPAPPGSMVVVSLHPTFRFMDRCGIAGSTRQIAQAIWNDRLPDRDPHALVRELYAAENIGKAEPFGSQDMAGLIYPGINRLDYDYAFQAGVFPCHVESNNDPEVARWLERELHIVPVAPRPEGYNPLGIKNLDRDWTQRLGQTGKDCYAPIQSVAPDLADFMEAMGVCTCEHCGGVEYLTVDHMDTAFDDIANTFIEYKRAELQKSLEELSYDVAVNEERGLGLEGTPVGFREYLLAQAAFRGFDAIYVLSGDRRLLVRAELREAVFRLPSKDVMTTLEAAGAGAGVFGVSDDAKFDMFRIVYKLPIYQGGYLIAYQSIDPTTTSRLFAVRDMKADWDEAKVGRSRAERIFLAGYVILAFIILFAAGRAAGGTSRTQTH